MKNNQSLSSFLLLLVFWVIPSSLFAASEVKFTSNGLTYRNIINYASGYITNGGYSTNAVSVYMASSSLSGKVTIPATVTYGGTNYKVVEIASGCFYDSNNITELEIGSNVSAIGLNAFHGCDKLEVITTNAVNPPTFDGYYGTSCLPYFYENIIVYVTNAGSVTSYDNAVGWKEFGARALPGANITAQSIKLSRTSASLDLGGTLNLSVTFNPVFTSNKSITWTSSNTSVASVTNGVVTAKAYGTAVITATSVYGNTASCSVTVKHSHSLTKTAEKAATCETAGNKAYWTCSGCKKVYSNSTATAETTVAQMTIPALGHSYGTPAWTWATDGKSASAKITCSHDATHVLSGNATVTSAVKTAATCEGKGTTTYTAKVTLNAVERTSTKDVQDIAALGHNFTYNDNGNGTHQKTCTRGDVNVAEAHDLSNGTCSLCSSVPVSGLTISQTSALVATTKSILLTCAIAPSNASISKIAWTSSNEDVAVVDDNGVVTAIAVGTATITAMTTDGTNLSATCVVTVESNTRVVLDTETAFANPADKQFDELSYSRNFGTTNYQCLYVPMTIDVADLVEDFYVYKIGALFLFDMNNNGVYFEPEDESVLRLIQLNEGVLLPNHPYYVAAKTTGQKVIPSYDNILYKSDEKRIDCSTIELTSTFSGNYTKKALGVEFFTLSGGEMKKFGTTSNLGAFRWYMTLTDREGQTLPITSNAKIRIDVINGSDETGIEDVKAYDYSKQVLGIYSLDGKKLNRLESGINVIKYKDGSNVKLFIK